LSSSAIANSFHGTDRGVLFLELPAKDIVPSAVPGAMNAFALSTSLVAWLTVALLWFMAAYFLLRMRKTTTLPRGEITSDVSCEIQSATTRS